jgi:threonine dehydrogenase-like Zn-dependent dehydrogenase
MEMGCLLRYDGDSFFSGCLAEPMSCIIGGFKKMFHTQPGSYELKIDIKHGGQLLILGGAGPMGIGTVDYAVKRNVKPRKIVVVDNVQEKLDRASSIASVEMAREYGVELDYINVARLSLSEQRELLLNASGNGGFDDVFLYAAVRELVELGDEVLAHDGCMTLFAGPYDNGFKSEINFYNIHYKSTHMVGLSGGTTQDMIEYLRMVEAGIMNPQVLITHIGGLNCVADTIVNLPATPGGKKLIYNGTNLELTALSDFAEKGKTDLLFAQLAELIDRTNGLWNRDAEEYLLQNAPQI